MRRGLALSVALAMSWASAGLACSVTTTDQGFAGSISSVSYGDPTDIYGHRVLGDVAEALTLNITFSSFDTLRCRRGSVQLAVPAGDGHVFEDLTPRTIDLDGDGLVEIITVRTSLTKGAQLAIYGTDINQVPGQHQSRQYQLIAATPYIGTRNRWLAPIGAADLDSDGFIEIAYIDRPHLAKTLRVWRFKDGDLTQVAAASGLTNHRIGEDFISGGIRDCGNGPEMITATADWSRIVAVRLVDGALQAQAVGPHEGRASFAAALNC